MSHLTRPIRSTLFAFAALLLACGAISSVDAADLAQRQMSAEKTSSLSETDYLGRNADLLLLRTRFGALLPEELPDLMSIVVQGMKTHGLTDSAVRRLRRDLTAELYYFIVNLKYLIMAEGAIWPQDKPSRTYRLDSMSELDAIADEIAAGDVLKIDINWLLHRLEAVNAWTEGLSQPIDDWFDPLERQRLVENALAVSDADAHASV